jgi:hypothetical protein
MPSSDLTHVPDALAFSAAVHRVLSELNEGRMTMRALTYLVAIFLKQLVEEKHKPRAFVLFAFYRDIY